MAPSSSKPIGRAKPECRCGQLRDLEQRIRDLSERVERQREQLLEGDRQLAKLTAELERTQVSLTMALTDAGKQFLRANAAEERIAALEAEIRRQLHLH